MRFAGAGFDIVRIQGVKKGETIAAAAELAAEAGDRSAERSDGKPQGNFNFNEGNPIGHPRIYDFEPGGLNLATERRIFFLGISGYPDGKQTDS